jgi:DUF1365 family protein
MGHQMRYRVYSLLIDIDEVDGLASAIPVFSHNRWNLISFHDKDHGPRDGSDLREWISPHLSDAGVDATGPIRMMVFPRILGYTFNPMTIWFVYSKDERLAAVLYEIHNTFGHAHSHLIVFTDGADPLKVPRHGFDKALHVSPFFDRTGRYEISLKAPSDDFSIAISYLDPEGERLLGASQKGNRREFTTRNLVWQFFAKPFVTIKVIVGIHLHAFRLLTKGAKYRSVPRPPAQEVESVILQHTTIDS